MIFNLFIFCHSEKRLVDPSPLLKIQHDIFTKKHLQNKCIFHKWQNVKNKLMKNLNYHTIWSELHVFIYTICTNVFFAQNLAIMWLASIFDDWNETMNWPQISFASWTSNFNFPYKAILTRKNWDDSQEAPSSSGKLIVHFHYHVIFL